MIPTIHAAAPTVVPSQTFDKWWVKSVSISSLNPNQPVHARVELAKFRTLEDGTAELSSETRDMEIEDVLAAAAQNESLAGVVAGLMAYIKSEAVARGLAVD